MIRQLLVGGAISAVNIAIHALVMTAVVQVARKASGQRIHNQSLFLMSVMTGTVLILMAAHTLEIIVWSISYAVVDATPAGVNRMYFAFVNYTTLGYGDVVPVPRWQLLGPITAMNGILMFGWSTAVIFEVLWRAMQIIDRGRGQIR